MDNKNEMVVQRYVDILTNGGFKALFGNVNNKDVVISILNVLLPEHRQIEGIDYLTTELQGPVVNQSKEYHYDFMCRDKSGTYFIVELQKYWEDDWFKRCVSYASRAYDLQNRRGQNYNVPPVYLIGLMDIEVGHPDKEFWKDRYVSEYTFREKDCHDLLAETIVISNEQHYVTIKQIVPYYASWQVFPKEPALWLSVFPYTSCFLLPHSRFHIRWCHKRP